MSGALLRGLILFGVFAGTMAVVPAWWCGIEAPAWYRGDLSRQRALARTVSAQIYRDLDRSDYQTGNGLYAGEWLFGTYLMAGLGFCQMALEHPEAAAEAVPEIERCIQLLLTEKVREFDRTSWKNDALQTLDSGRGHAAYLGYLNLLLALYAEVRPGNSFTVLHERISRALESRMAASANGLIETYPGEWYPVDNAAGLASLALRARNSGGSIASLVENYRRRAIDPATGLLIQALDASGAQRDQARGSGSILAAFFLAHGLPELADALFAAARRELATRVLGFGAMREYPRGQDGPGDIDSGPVVFGLGFSATGFAIGGARMCGDPALFRSLVASARLAGAPIHPDGRIEFVTAGPLGNAILFAMLTAGPRHTP